MQVVVWNDLQTHSLHLLALAWSHSLVTARFLPFSHLFSLHRFLRAQLNSSQKVVLRVKDRITHEVEAGNWLCGLQASAIHMDLATEPCCRFWYLASTQEWIKRVQGLTLGECLGGAEIFAGNRIGIFDSLGQLSLRGCRLGDAGARTVFTGLRAGCLTNLDLFRTGLGDRGLGYIVEALKRERCALEHLNLGGNCFFAEGAKRLTNLNVTRLYSLDLSRTVVRAFGMLCFAAHLFRNTIQFSWTLRTCIPATSDFEQGNSFLQFNRLI